MSYEMLKALINSTRWADKVAELLGNEWDNQGRELIDCVWSLAREEWGDEGVGVIADYVFKGSYKYYDVRGRLHECITVKDLYEALESNKY